jgi:hypothetical protein
MLRDIAVEQLKQYKTKSADDAFIQEVLTDFWICCVSREASLLGRKEVLGGKAKFGILGDGKEVPQVALARFFKKETGDPDIIVIKPGCLLLVFQL